MPKKNPNTKRKSGKKITSNTTVEITTMGKGVFENSVKGQIDLLEKKKEYAEQKKIIKITGIICATVLGTIALIGLFFGNTGLTYLGTGVLLMVLFGIASMVISNEGRF